MDTYNNPFSPGAGMPPPELVGRAGIIDEVQISQKRAKNNMSAQSILFYGLRGVGKTVLLREMEKMAKNNHCHTVFLEANEHQPLAQTLAGHLRELLLDFDPVARMGKKAKRALAALAGFIGSLKISMPGISLDIAPALGVADSGDLGFDLPGLFAAVAEAAAEQQTAIILFIDEVQCLKRAEFAALIAAIHRIQQLQLPLLLIGAGLPTLPRLAGEAKSYSERLFNFFPVDALDDEDAKQALVKPAQSEGVTFQPDAIAEIIDVSKGYPYFLQKWGYEIWNYASEPIIGTTVVQEIAPTVIKQLDNSFFRVRFDRLTASEKSLLRAMAECPSEKKRTADVAGLLGIKISNASPRRESLIKKGMIYSPSHGYISFTVPLFGDFMKREMPEFNPATDD